MSVVLFKYLLLSACGLSLTSLVVLIALWLRQNRLQDQLDDQGINLIQFGNLAGDLKKETAALQTSISSLVDHLDRTKLRQKPLRDEDDEPTEKLQTGSLSESRAVEVTNAQEQPTNPRAITRARFTSEETDSGDPSNEVVLDGLRVLEAADFESGAKTHVRHAEDAGARSKEIPLVREFAVLEEFFAEFQGNISKSGLFLATDQLLAVGTRVDLDFHLRNSRPILTGKGEVKRVYLDSGGPHKDKKGMQIRFIYLNREGKAIIRKLAAAK